MGAVPNEYKTPAVALDLSRDVLAVDVTEIANLTLYDQTGNTANLPSANAKLEMEAWMMLALRLKCVAESLADFRSGRTVGRGRQYSTTYATMGTDKSWVSYSGLGVTTLPTQANQIIMWKDGVLMSSTDWIFQPNGITLGDVLVSNERLDIDIVTVDEARIRKLYSYDGGNCTGTGNRILTIATLPADKNGNAISPPPSTAYDISIFVRGLHRSTAAGDYTVTGTENNMVIVFGDDLAVDDTIDLDIRS
jgi:hypothetical protein